MYNNCLVHLVLFFFFRLSFGLRYCWSCVPSEHNTKDIIFNRHTHVQRDRDRGRYKAHGCYVLQRNFNFFSPSSCYWFSFGCYYFCVFYTIFFCFFFLVRLSFVLVCCCWFRIVVIYFVFFFKLQRNFCAQRHLKRISIK